MPPRSSRGGGLLQFRDHCPDEVGDVCPGEGGAVVSGGVVAVVAGHSGLVEGLLVADRRTDCSRQNYVSLAHLSNRLD